MQLGRRSRLGWALLLFACGQVPAGEELSFPKPRLRERSNLYCLQPSPLPEANFETVALFSGSAEHLVLDEHFAYLAVTLGPEARRGEILRVSLDDQRTTVLAQSSRPTGLALASRLVIWSDGAQIKSVPAIGGPTQRLADEPDHASGVFATDARVLWANTGSAAGGSIRELRSSGPTPGTLASGTFRPGRVVADESSVYWTSYLGAPLWRAPLGGGEPEALWQEPGPPLGLWVDEFSVYWSSDDRVFALLKEEGRPRVLATVQSWPRGLAVDECHLYWASGGSIIRVSKLGGPLTVVAEGQANPAAVAVSQAHIYWTADGALMRRPR